MKLKFLVNLKENQYVPEKGSSNYVELKKLKKFDKSVNFIPEVSGLTFIADGKEIPLIYNKKDYSLEIIDDKSLKLTCKVSEISEDITQELLFMGIDVKKINETLKKTTEIEPMYVILEVEGYDMFTQDFDITLEEIEIEEGFCIKESVIDYYNRCN